MEAQTRRERRRSVRRGRAIRRGLLVAAGVLIGVVGGFAWEAMSARASLARAEPLLTSARAAASEAKLDVATGDLRTAQRHVQAAVSRARGPFTRIAGWIPIAGRTARAIRIATESADLAVQAGLRASQATEAFPTDENGSPSFGFSQGRIPVESWRQAAAPIAAADVLAAQAADRAAEAPRSLVLSPVRRALQRLDENLATLRDATRHAVSLSTVIPALAGGDGAAKRYLLAFQNPAELRGTGGLLGGVALLEARDGAIELTGEAPDNEFGELDAPAADMPEWFINRYDRFEARTLWSHVNLEPDFPTTAPLIAAYYTRVTGEKVDGVIALDPHALAAMLEATGPITGPHGVTFRAETVAKFIMNDAYSLYETDSVLRKAVVLEAASVIFDAIKRGVGPVTLASALAESAHQKRIQVWMRDPGAQAAVAALGVDGAFLPPASAGAPPHIGVVTQNAGANKIDFYLKRSMQMQVSLREDGGASVDLSIALRNTAPASGLPRDVIGPSEVEGRPGVVEVGINKTFLSLYLPENATEIAWAADGEPADSEQNPGPGVTITSRFVEIPAGATSTQRVTFDLPAGTFARESLALTLPHQAVVSADHWQIRIVAPRGHRVAGEATWSTTRIGNRDILLELPVERTALRRIKDVVWR